MDAALEDGRRSPSPDHDLWEIMRRSIRAGRPAGIERLRARSFEIYFLMISMPSMVALSVTVVN